MKKIKKSKKLANELLKAETKKKGEVKYIAIAHNIRDAFLFMWGSDQIIETFSTLAEAIKWVEAFGPGSVSSIELYEIASKVKITSKFHIDINEKSN